MSAEPEKYAVPVACILSIFILTSILVGMGGERAAEIACQKEVPSVDVYAEFQWLSALGDYNYRCVYSSGDGYSSGYTIRRYDGPGHYMVVNDILANVTMKRLGIW